MTLPGAALWLDRLPCSSAFRKVCVDPALTRERAQSFISSTPHVWGLQLFRALRNVAQAVLVKINLPFSPMV